MSHLLSFLEHYSHMQRLQEKASEYRARLRREEARRKKQLKALGRAYRQKMRDKVHLIENLEDIINEQQNFMMKHHNTGNKLPITCPPFPVAPAAAAGVHRLVESISTLQGERSKLMEEVSGLQEEMERREKEKQCLANDFNQQVQDLKQKIQEREEELARLRMETNTR
ncbi:ankyrin repeat domain-containing protein 24-like [Latimeria chalumnae]|uniref:ankyrin repeat domain-containing protein 24-like n=1 Tax=Latimeria chalumnae TaxID=7897 RepID=UPI00313BB6D1